MKNFEYIKSLDEIGIMAFANVMAGGDMDVFDEQCSLCKFGNFDKCLEDSKAGAGAEIQKECDKVARRWLFDEARALIKAVEAEKQRLEKEGINNG